MKYFIAILIFTSINAFASESKIICGHESSTRASVLADTEEHAVKDINSKIKLAELEGFTKVSAPVGVNSAGHTQSFCVTVTKP